MDSFGLPRRHMFGFAAASVLPVSAAKAANPPRRALFDLTNPQDQLTAFVKVKGSLDAEDVPHWYFGTVYGVIPGKAPIPMVELEGSEIDYYIKQPDGSYHCHSKTISYFRDVKTRAYITTYNNPITGKVNTITPNTIEGGKYYVYAVNGFMRSDEKGASPGTTPRIGEYLKWTESGDWAWLNTERPYPPGLPFGESQSAMFPLAELHDPSLKKVKTSFGHPTYISPWLGWMDMKDVPGHVVWAVDARKMNAVKEYPKAFLAKLEKDYPDKLTAKPI
jgi:hypothetical protein